MGLIYPAGKRVDIAWGQTEAELQANRRPAGNRLKVEALCGKCNNEWLGALEKRVKPRLSAWIMGIHNAMTVQDQKRLSLWAVKTAMTVQIAHAKVRQVIPMPEYHRLYRAQTHPPSGMYVWMQLMRVPSPVLGFGTLIRNYRYPVKPAGSAKTYSAYRVTLFIRHVTFYILGHDGPDGVDLAQVVPNEFAAIGQRMNQIWPAISRYAVAPPILR